MAWKQRVLTVVLSLMFSVTSLLASAGVASADESIILDTLSFWRMHYTLQAPVYREGSRLEKAPLPYYETALPPETWADPEFDDTSWRRVPGPPFPPLTRTWAVPFARNAGFLATNHDSPALALITMRGKFTVDDPAAAQPLTFTARYRGGIVVYVNGHEIARAHLPSGQGLEEVAEDYPAEAFLDAEGKLLVANLREDDEENLRRWELRTRTINAQVEPRYLREGVNVLAVEIHRAPYDGQVPGIIKSQSLSAVDVADRLWSTCGLRDLRLSGPRSGGVAANVVRPEGTQVWNSDPLSVDYSLDFGDPNEALEPIHIVAAQNGRFSGKVVVGSRQALGNVRAEVSDLVTEEGGKIPASAIEVRYGRSGPGESGPVGRYGAIPVALTTLDETAPDEVAVINSDVNRGNREVSDATAPVMGAVLPVWVTVHVPSDASANDYVGQLTVHIEGEQPIEVPVHVQVSEFRLPAPQDFHVFVDFVQSPESVALQYDVPLWSDEHFRLLAKAYRLLGQAGNDVIYVPLLSETNQGNAETMVRWIEDGRGGYRYDFSILERFLEMVKSNMGDPEKICLYVWEPKFNDELLVSVVDGNGEAETHKLPGYGDSQSERLWRPVLHGVVERLKEHDWEDKIILGVGPDASPPEAVPALFAKMLPGVGWMRHAHTIRNGRGYGGAQLDYQSLVWSPKFVEPPDSQRLQGWKNPELITQFTRTRGDRFNGIIINRLLAEMNIQGEQRGFGRLGFDFWNVLEGRRGSESDIQGEGRYSSWRNLDWMLKSIVRPGPDGALSTHQFEMICEGLQEAEARILIERALDERRIRGDLADRCHELLEQRTMDTGIALYPHFVAGFSTWRSGGGQQWGGQIGCLWVIASDWQARSAKLFDL
ncbi:MAG: glycoside hydrolase domain-containing protein, partial [Phycisphaeraceae bacterium]